MAIIQAFKPLNGSLSTINLYSFEETCILLKLPFHAKLNGLLSKLHILKYPQVMIV